MPTMASKLKERRVSGRPLCAHNSAEPLDRPDPGPLTAFPFKKTPTSTKQLFPPPRSKNKPAVLGPPAQTGSPGGSAERTRHRSILPWAASRLAPLLGARLGPALLEG